MRKTITFLKGAKKGSETEYLDALPVNMSGITKQMFGAAGYMLQQPGLTNLTTGAGIDRGGLWNERRKEHLRISGTSLITIASDGTVANKGPIPGTKTASLPYSFNSQCIIADGRMWLYTGTLTEVTDPDLGIPIDGVWIDQYYFLTDGENIYHTLISDETQIDPLQFATSEYSPDPTLAVAKTTDNKAIVFDRYSIQYFSNIASGNFAFTRLTQRGIKSGIVGTHCKTEMGGQFYIMGGRKEEDVSIHVVGVGGTVKVASREVDKIIGQYTELQLADSVLETRVEEDYQYIIVHLPNETLLFNANVAKKTGVEYAWSILRSDVLGEVTYRAIHGIFEPRLGKWVYGDKQDATIGVLDDKTATHYGSIAAWELHTPFLELESMSVDQLDIETIPGFTVTDDATVSISLTYDGVYYGKEWFQMYGEPSQYGKRFILYSLGYVANWIGIKLRGASRSRMAFSRAFIDAE